MSNKKFLGIEDPDWNVTSPIRDADGRYSKSAYRREINGRIHRICSGPGHDVPTWLPETDKYFSKHKSGKRAGSFDSRCRLCMNWSHLKDPSRAGGYVPAADVRVWFIEGVNRVGYMEFCRRTGLNDGTVRPILKGERRYVRKDTVKRAMMAVISMRRKGEVRHRDSIRHGSKIRGRMERVPTERTHLYKPHGDNDSEQKRRKMKETEHGAIPAPDRRFAEHRDAIATTHNIPDSRHQRRGRALHGGRK